MRILKVLLRRMSSLNDRSKLKGQYTDVKSGCGLSVGHSLHPHSLSLKNVSRATVPLRGKHIYHERKDLKYKMMVY